MKPACITGAFMANCFYLACSRRSEAPGLGETTSFAVREEGRAGEENVAVKMKRGHADGRYADLTN